MIYIYISNCNYSILYGGKRYPSITVHRAIRFSQPAVAPILPV